MVKKILIVATVLLIAVSQHSSFAQYAPSVQSDETQELSYNQANLPYEIGKGVHMVDAGKTLLFTGASFALTGSCSPGPRGSTAPRDLPRCKKPGAGRAVSCPPP